eukprot:4171661-Pyramimonas_sp.AAC.1
MIIAPLGPSIELPLGPRNAAPGAGTACGLRHWGHADSATGTFGGAPHGATERCTGRGNRMRTAP